MLFMRQGHWTVPCSETETETVQNKSQCLLARLVASATIHLVEYICTVVSYSFPSDVLLHTIHF